MGTYGTKYICAWPEIREPTLGIRGTAGSNSHDGVNSSW